MFPAPHRTSPHAVSDMGAVDPVDDVVADAPEVVADAPDVVEDARAVVVDAPEVAVLPPTGGAATQFTPCSLRVNSRPLQHLYMVGSKQMVSQALSFFPHNTVFVPELEQLCVDGL